MTEMDDQTAPHVEYGVTPTEVMASMAGVDFVRAIFEGRLPAPPIMQNVEPFDCTAEPGIVVLHSIPGVRHYNPIGSVHGGYIAILLDSAMGLAVHSMLPAGTGYTTLEFKISFIKGMTKDTRSDPHRRPYPQCRPSRRHGRGPHHRHRRPPAGARHHDLPGFRDSQIEPNDKDGHANG
jgi:acyl-coenzyme A thioesterase PaaI-like protein